MPRKNTAAQLMSAHLGFTPVISPDLKEMDPGIFEEHWGGLKEYLK